VATARGLGPAVDLGAAAIAVLSFCTLVLAVTTIRGLVSPSVPPAADRISA
jgi:hypothetical protein